MKGRSLILITCVIVLSFAGVGYSAWTEGLNIKSLFATGNVHVIFEDPVIVNHELFEISADAREGVLEIYGTVTPGSTVLVAYDIYNDSSILVKYHPDDEALPEGIILDQNDTVLKPGEYLRGNQIVIVPGENELILPFVQYNSSGSNGWKEELTIRWNITVVEEMVNPEMDMMNGSETEEAPVDDVPQAEEPTEDVTQAEEPIRDSPGPDSPAAETKPGADSGPDTDTTDPDSANNPPPDTPAAEAPSGTPSLNENLNEITIESEIQTETDD